MHPQGKRLFINLILEFYSVTSLLISLILVVSKYIFKLEYVIHLNLSERTKSRHFFFEKQNNRKDVFPFYHKRQFSCYSEK